MRALIVVAMLIDAAPARACQPGIRCYEPVVVEEAPIRYVRSARGRIPRGRVAAFLQGAIWRPVYARPAGDNGKFVVRHVAGNALRFTTAKKRAALGETRDDIVIVKLDGQGRVDVYGMVWTLVPCPAPRNVACLVRAR